MISIVKGKTEISFYHQERSTCAFHRGVRIKRSQDKAASKGVRVKINLLLPSLNAQEQENKEGNLSVVKWHWNLYENHVSQNLKLHNGRAPMSSMHSIGLDIHKKTTTFCCKEGHGLGEIFP